MSSSESSSDQVDLDKAEELIGGDIDIQNLDIYSVDDKGSRTDDKQGTKSIDFGISGDYESEKQLLEKTDSKMAKINDSQLVASEPLDQK